MGRTESAQYHHEFLRDEIIIAQILASQGS
jgi:hypothetical protein